MSGFLGRGIGPMALKRRRAAAADWWQVAGQTCVAAYQPIGAASLAASYVNLANPGTYNAAPGVAPTLAAGGWSFNAASSQYLATGFFPASGCSVLIRYSNAGADECLIGQVSGTNLNCFLYGSNGSEIYYANGGLATASPARPSGVLCVAGQFGYFNGESVGSALTAWSGAALYALNIGRRNGASPVHYTSATIAAVAIYSTTLSAADVAELTTRMQALA